MNGKDGFPSTSTVVTRLALVLALLFVLARPARADFNDGLRAFDAGDYTTAVAEWHAAADQGEARAQFRLGQLFEQGLGVLQNFVQAHFWYNLAAAQGHAEARKARNALAEKMTREQVARAQKLAADWRPGQAPAPEVATVQAGVEGDESELLTAVRDGDAEKVKALLAKGANPNAKTAARTPVLALAVAYNHRDVVEALLAAGAQVDGKMANGWTALMLATFWGQTDIANLLMERGPEVKVEAP